MNLCNNITFSYKLQKKWLKKIYKNSYNCDGLTLLNPNLAS